MRVRYGVNSRPDPPSVPGRLGPTGSGRARTSKSATLKNQADLNWFNVPWVGNANTIIARVKNNGALDALRYGPTST